MCKKIYVIPKITVCMSFYGLMLFLSDNSNIEDVIGGISLPEIEI